MEWLKKIAAILFPNPTVTKEFNVTYNLSEQEQEAFAQVIYEGLFGVFNAESYIEQLKSSDVSFDEKITLIIEKRELARSIYIGSDSPNSYVYEAGSEEEKRYKQEEEKKREVKKYMLQSIKFYEIALHNLLNPSNAVENKEPDTAITRSVKDRRKRDNSSANLTGPEIALLGELLLNSGFLNRADGSKPNQTEMVSGLTTLFGGSPDSIKKGFGERAILIEPKREKEIIDLINQLIVSIKNVPK